MHSFTFNGGHKSWLTSIGLLLEEGNDNLHWVEAKDGEVPPAALKVHLLAFFYITCHFVFVHFAFLCAPCWDLKVPLLALSPFRAALLSFPLIPTSDWIRVERWPSFCGKRQGREGWLWQRLLHVCGQDESQIWPRLPALWWKGIC